MSWGVTGGGITVLAAVVLIFLYLVWTVAPVFVPSSVEFETQIGTKARTALLYDVSESNDVVLRIAGDGIAEFYDYATGQPLAAFDVGVDLRAAQPVYPRLDLYALLDVRGRLHLVRADYEVTIRSGKRAVTPRLVTAFGEQPLSLGASDMFDVRLESGDLKIARGREDQVEIVHFTGVEDGLALPAPKRYSLGAYPRLRHIFIGPRNEWVYLIDGEQFLQVRDATTDTAPPFFRTPLVAPERELTAVTPLLGRQSLMVADDRGVLTQWTVLRDALGFRMQPIRYFELSATAHSVVAERRRKGVVSINRDGAMQLIYPAADAVSATFMTDIRTPVPMMISPRADLFLAGLGSDRIGVYRLYNPHPEISIATLWSRVWYEGYGKPVFSWQSSSADNDFEPKFSLTPLLFGTIKAAFYALLFALPLAIMGAIYTAYFMHPRMRAWIKPGIEVMAALPTVILGFIGGLWLAPLVEENLSSVLMSLLTVPATLVLLAFAWTWVPEHQRARADGWHAIFVVPVIIVAVVLSFQVGPWFESSLFGGDSRTWLREVAGLDYAQRNALVVGMMMGLAVIPTIFSIAEDAIHGVPGHLVSGSLALGATPWQTLTRVVLLTAAPGIFSAVMVGFGRAVGETMIVLMATGNTPLMEINIFEGMRTFAANIAVELPESEVGSSHFRILFLTALVLFIMTFFFNTFAEVVRQRLRSHYGNL